MQAILTNRPQKFTVSFRKEDHFRDEYAVLLPDGSNPVTLRLYQPGSTVYAALWAGERSGTGRAQGGGYHKPSAAAAEAIRNAGIDLDEDIDGRGESSIRTALLAIAEALGHRNAFLHHAHA